MRELWDQKHFKPILLYCSIWFCSSSSIGRSCSYLNSWLSTKQLQKSRICCICFGLQPILDPFVSDEKHMFRSRRKMFCDGKSSNTCFHYL